MLKAYRPKPYLKRFSNKVNPTFLGLLFFPMILCVGLYDVCLGRCEQAYGVPKGPQSDG